MKDSSYIIEAIDVLIAMDNPKPKPRWWMPVLDAVLTVAYLSAYVYVIYRVIRWLS